MLAVMLFKRRKHERRLVEREVAGESFWASEFGAKSRVRVIRAFSKSLSSEEFHFVVSQAQESVAFDEGVVTLRNRRDQVEDCDTDEFASCIEALFKGVEKATGGSYVGIYMSWSELYEIRKKIREVIRADRLAWELDDDVGKSTFTSRELHREVVIPALTLFSEPGRDGRTSLLLLRGGGPLKL